jgi:hypothetical protein
MKMIKLWLKSNWQQVFLVLVLILTAGYVINLQRGEIELNNNVTNNQESVNDKVFEYKGEEGKDALTLLKEKTEVNLDNVGMVVSIDGTKANSEGREFWAFYVNGEMAQVGAADYKSKDTDIIDWRIEKY